MVVTWWILLFLPSVMHKPDTLLHQIGFAFQKLNIDIDAATKCKPNKDTNMSRISSQQCFHLCQGGNAFASSGLSVCLSVSNITQTITDGF